MRIFALILLLLVTPSVALGHGDISKLPPSVQILQYKMQLYMNPDDMGTRNKIALAYIATGKLDEAETNIQQVLDKDKNNFDALDEMGLVKFRQGKYKEALEYFDRAATINPDDMMVHVHKFQALSRLNQQNKAKTELACAKALAKSPEDAKRIEKEIAFLSGKKADSK